MKIRIEVDAPTLYQCREIIDEFIREVSRGGWLIKGCGSDCWYDSEASGDAPDWPVDRGRKNRHTGSKP